MWRALSILLICLWPWAVGATPLDEAEQAILQGRAAAAIPMLERYSPQTRTEALRRLWMLGVANNRAGRAQAAVEPLAKLVAQVPESAAFRLELAGALLRAGQSERARYHLEQVKGTDLPPAVQAQVQAQLDRMQKPKAWQGYFRFALVPESNAAHRTQAEVVNLGGLVFDLAPGARQQAANGVELGFGLAALPRLSDGLRARFGVDVHARIFDGRAPNDVTARASAGLLHFGDAGRQISAEVFASQRWLDDVLYSRGRGVGLSYGRVLGARTRLTLGAQHELLDYRSGAYGVNRSAASLQLAYAASPQLMLRGALRAEHRTSSYTQAAGAAMGASIGGDYLFAGGLRLGLDLSYDHNAYDGRHPLFGVQRVDEKWAATVQLTNQNWNYRGFAPVLKLGAEQQDSSIVLNSYRNLSASVGITRAF